MNRSPFMQKLYEILADRPLFLNATEERRNKLKDVIEFFDRQIADNLVYELYFKEKFAEVVSKHLKAVNYDRWSELYWKRELEGDLKPEEEKELKDLENENLKTIIEVVKAIKSDREIMELIEKIKGHEWVRLVEG
ncbi:MAG: hypothetical protein SCAL_001599 [Candidatus Syntrophoarchaeum caldarius]|uniref:Uncharacterized protein n=1 Tax=Candidatus Syntropharchaeum caldarium TaxID=1838285 RepID=A0A1F2P7P6_9EURY|nr:MAG: hypothetical protein SCAL_001599 [Candidatus Syntrophoarchaeum caldarius]